MKVTWDAFICFISLLFWWKLLRCFYLCFLGLFVLMKVTWDAFCLCILYRWKLLEMLLFVFFKFICFDESYLDAFCLCFKCLEFSSWKKKKFKSHPVNLNIYTTFYYWHSHSYFRSHHKSFLLWIIFFYYD